MDHQAVLARYDRELRRDAPADGPGARIERDGRVVRQVAADGGWNGVVWSDLDAATADAAIAAQVRFFAGLGGPFEWKWYAHDRPADLGDRLLAAGFTPEPAETLMVAGVRDLPAEPAPPAGVMLRQVTDAAGVDLLVDVHDRAFGTPHPHQRRRLLAQLAERPDAVLAVVAVAGGEPVSAGRLELPAGTGFAGLWGGGTVPGWRGRGIYRALVAYRARRAAARGYDHLQVDASAQSRPILERLGFTPLTTTVPYVHPGTATG